MDTAAVTIAHLAEQLGVSAHTLRYYERAGLIRPVPRNAGNQRRYRPEDVEWLRFLLRLRETGMPIAEMRRYAQLRAEGEASVADRLALLTEHHRRLLEQLDRLRRHEAALATKITTYQNVLAEQSEHPTVNGETHA